MEVVTVDAKGGQEAQLEEELRSVFRVQGEGEGEGGVEDRPQQLEQRQRPSKRLLKYQDRVEQVYTRPTNLPEGAKDTGPFKKSNKVEGIVKELRLRELANYTNLRA